MIALCASHIDSKERLVALDHMLQSVSAQTHHIEMYISISGIQEHQCHEIIKHRSAWLHVTFREIHLTQFEHYKLLCEDLKSEKIDKDTWCIFTDDDDLWHKQRVEKYTKAIERSCTDVVKCESGMLFNGKLSQGAEYVDFATKFKVFVQFFINARQELLKLRGCDLIWRNVLRCTPCTLFTAGTWLYRYDIPEERQRLLVTYLDACREGWEIYMSDNNIQHGYMAKVWALTPAPISV